MILIDLQKQIATVTSAATIALGSASTGFRTVAQAIAAGDIAVGATGIAFFVRDPATGAFESGEYTITSATQLTRERVLTSSNNNAAVAFGGASCEVYSAASASLLNALTSGSDIAFATAVPLNSAGRAYMPQTAIAAGMTFSPAATKVRGARVEVRLVADGTNTPTFTGMKEFGGSSGFDSRAGIVNVVEFYYDGYDVWYYIGQAAGATVVDSIAPTAQSASVTDAAPSTIYIQTSEVLDMANALAPANFVVSGHPITAADVYFGDQTKIRLTTSAAFVGGEAARSVVYTPTGGVSDVRDPAGNKMLGFTQAITNSVSAPAGSPASGVTLAGPTSGTVSTASTDFTVGVTPVGGTITGTVVVTPSDGGAGGTFSPTSVSLTSASPSGTFTYTPASTGAKTISVSNNGSLSNPTNITYTAAAAATVPAAPTIGTAVAGDGYVDVYFTRNSNGGATVLDSTATLSTGQTATGASSPIRVTAPNGTAVTATVKDRNSVGSSAASAASNSVTPTAGAYARFSAATNFTESGTGPYKYTATASGAQATADKTLGAAGVDGSMSLKYEGIGLGVPYFGLQSTGSGPIGVGSFAIYMTVTGGIYATNTTASPINANANMAPAEGDILRMRRTGTAVYAEVARAATPTNFVEIAHWPTVNAVNKWFSLVAQTGQAFTLTNTVGLI
jgi:hypothetical protein